MVLHGSQALRTGDRTLKLGVFRSPPFSLGPGAVAHKFFLKIPFPNGHIALKSFNAEVVDENGVSVPLHEVYLHHWYVVRYYGEKGAIVPGEVKYEDLSSKSLIMERNYGICKGTLNHYFALGSAHRGTNTWIPDPYGIEIGNPKDIPEGYQEMWMMNVHAIDVQGVEDPVGCIECRCHLYNATKDVHGHPFTKDYIGGMYRCYGDLRCRLREGFDGPVQRLHMKYTMTWADWHDSIVPLKVYILDVTGSRDPAYDPHDGNRATSICKVEYDVQKRCDLEGKANGECVDTTTARLVIPCGGDIVYGVAHQHLAGLGSTLYGQDGRALCTSLPIYGQGKEAGNEDGYLVGMSTCYPQLGSAKVADGEVLTVESNYSSTQPHTGVMGHFYILVAELQPQPEAMLPHGSPISWRFELSKNTWAYLLACGILAVIMAVSFRGRYDGEEGYDSLNN